MFHPFVGQPVEPLPVAILGIWKRADVIIHIMNAAGDRNNHPFHQKDSKVAEWMQDMYRHLYIYIYYICVCVCAPLDSQNVCYRQNDLTGKRLKRTKPVILGMCHYIYISIYT